MAKRRNIFSRIPETLLRQLVAESKSIAEVFDKLKLRRAGAPYRIFHRVVAELNIDTSHFLGIRHMLGKTGWTAKTHEEVFKLGSSASGSVLRGHIRRRKLLEYKCVACGNVGEWQGQSLVLHLDHENGDRTDCRLENLRWLCPNCHSQTPTYCGKARKRKVHICPKCEKPYKGYGRQCRKCADSNREIYVDNAGRSRVNWPSREDLQKLVWQVPLTQVAAQLQCTDSSVRKRCLAQAIPLPPHGYWHRLKAGYTIEQAMVSQKKIRPKAKRISVEDICRAKELMAKGASLRHASHIIGCSHATLLRRLEGDPVLLLSTHGNAKHIKQATPSASAGCCLAVVHEPS